MGGEEGFPLAAVYIDNLLHSVGSGCSTEKAKAKPGRRASGKSASVFQGRRRSTLLPGGRAGDSSHGAAEGAGDVGRGADEVRCEALLQADAAHGRHLLRRRRSRLLGPLPPPLRYRPPSPSPHSEPRNLRLPRRVPHLIHCERPPPGFCVFESPWPASSNLPDTSRSASALPGAIRVTMALLHQQAPKRVAFPCPT